MGGVNTNRNYAELMGFGHWNETTHEVDVDDGLLQGGIVRWLANIVNYNGH